MRCLLDRLDDGEFAYPMDNGAVVKVAIRGSTRSRSAVFDISPAPVTNCPAISTTRVRSPAPPALYVLRNAAIDECDPE